jgi:hypothetical protein
MASNTRSINFLSVLWEYGKTNAANVSEQSAFASRTSLL